MLFISSILVFLTVMLNSVQAQTVNPTASSLCSYDTSDLEGTIIRIDNYNQVRCVWTITAPLGYSIHLNITIFNLPGSSGSCLNDYLIINGVIAENNTEIKPKLCGSQTFPGTFKFWNSVNIEYSYSGSGLRYTSSAFTLVYRAVFLSIYRETTKWISKNEETLLRDKESLPRALPALRLFNETYFSKQNMAGYKFKTQYLLKLSEDLLRNSTQPLSVADLSHHVFALLSVCINPRSFHGFDLVHRLRSDMDKTPKAVNPFDLLTLCSSGENLTSADINKLSDTLNNTERPNIYMLDFQAIAVLTLICAKEQNQEISVDEDLETSVNALTSYQRKDGSFGSLRSTVLIVQALSAAGAPETKWNKTLALRFIQSWNHTDGSFGNKYDMYTVLPVLKDKTLLDVNTEKCDFSPDGISPLQEIKDKLTKFISLNYQLWVGDGADVKHTIALKFPNGTKFFDVMRLAAENDEKFHLKWTFVKEDLYIYEIAGHINDPTGGKYWNLYTFNHQRKQLVLFEERLETYVPRDGDTAVMWYRTVNL